MAPVVDKSEEQQDEKTAAGQKAADDKFFKDFARESGSDGVEKEKGAEEEATEGAEEEKAPGSEEAGEQEEGKEGEESESAEEGAEEEAAEGDDKEKTPAQKRIDELTAEKRRLQAENNRLKGVQDEGAKDPDLAKLEKMSTEQLRALKRELLFDFRKEEDEGRARRLLELIDKADETISSAPSRLERTQLNEYQKAVAATAEELGEQFTEQAQERIFTKAKVIFGKSAALQAAPDGQAVAWSLAVDWYRDVTKLQLKAEKTDELRRDNNKLRKKVTLDTAVKKGAEKTSEQNRNFTRAKAGDRGAELKWIKEELGL